MNQYLISYTLFSQKESVSAKDVQPSKSIELAVQILNRLEIGDDLYVTIVPSGDRLIISVVEQGVYVELDCASGGYLGKTVGRSEAREILESSDQYFNSPEDHGFELMPYS
ncbi:hypothetical protein [Pseudoteredinibacter isoporae]|uniref:Na+-transporting NADH:ubiquinone oxidoreductase subunit NqrF n=1 Tax=Pseudoteredinibacter isoporae TaxID=570281 RepID=A0A7X0JPV4_9GAMM|nr:hypothetical protein [Pseudoteredinibacter isoporae]MBB6520012.1 Na+-transporting NADH:ubiquinone oxidoreductase subunit NqrF [Pseudoteredinibacter isoporae]NHO85584.1 hypothetical protein [Pseudoteredinibacter isoporae]NIB25964.1 hypothetical protein [Pseudoteredinibacter isoporae]